MKYRNHGAQFFPSRSQSLHFFGFLVSFVLVSVVLTFGLDQTQVRGFVHKDCSPQPSLNDSLDGEIQSFLIDEDQLHTYDDLTKVNPVTPTTGKTRLW